MLLRTLKFRYLGLPPMQRCAVFASVVFVLYICWVHFSFRPASTYVTPLPLAIEKPAIPISPSIQASNKATIVTNRGKTPEWPDNNHEVTILVLGYSLHKDGMPQRIMKDRVDKAAEVYFDLVKDGIHPLLVLSGKGKTGSFVEAHVMKDIALCADIAEDDILIEDKSTSTVENALFTSKLIEAKRLSVLYVVTSDYHILRTQYIFSTVIPSNVELKFVPAKTEQGLVSLAWSLEYNNFAATEGELKLKKIIDEKDSYGYHPIRNFPRWKMIEHEIENDIRVNPELLTKGGSDMVMVDYGSNYGYFSLHLAEKFPKGTVISLEGEAVTEYKSAATHHKEKMEELQVNNNVLCKIRTQPDSFARLFEEKQVYQYQLCLSVFHWFDMPTKDIFEESLYHLLSNARTTFIELPEARLYIGKEGQHAWDSVNKWYNGRNEVQIIHDIGQKYEWRNYEVKVVGGILHDNHTVRKMLRVDVTDNKANASVDTALKAYQCTEENIIKPRFDNLQQQQQQQQ